jgi:protein gp37
MAFWNPWNGCKRVSEGCRYCFIHEGAKKRKLKIDKIIKAPGFDAPIKKRNGSYIISSGSTIYTSFKSDFLIEEADVWREECWAMIRERSDCQFVFLTKRIERLNDCLPSDWGRGYENVTIGVSVENQKMADKRLPILHALPIRHKNIICQPLLGAIDISDYLGDIELVMAGGEYHKQGRAMDYKWVLAIRQQCIAQNIPFEFRQCSTHFIKEGVAYQLSYRQLFSQAKKAAINWYPE